MLILINDSWIEKEEAKVDLFSDALMFGFGIFETLRTYEGKKLFLLENHLDRLVSSAHHINLNINYTIKEIGEMVLNIVEKSVNDLQRIKIIAIPEKLIIVSTKLEINQNIYQGVSVESVPGKRSLPAVKSISYLDCYLGYKRAIEKGFFEAILVDKHNYVYEGTRSNIFWFEEETLFTREKDVLPGIIRSFVIKNSPYEVKYHNIKIDYLKNKDEVFITNSILGITSIIKIDDKKIGNGIPGQKTINLKKLFHDTIKEIINNMSFG